jgi:hypothetical protein
MADKARKERRESGVEDMGESYFIRRLASSDYEVAGDYGDFHFFR